MSNSFYITLARMSPGLVKSVEATMLDYPYGIKENYGKTLNIIMYQSFQNCFQVQFKQCSLTSKF